MTKIRDVALMRRKTNRAFEQSRDIIRCVLVGVDFTDTPAVDGKAGFVWARENNNDSGVFQVFNPYIQARVGLIVLVADDPKPPYRRMIIDVDWGAMLDNGDYVDGEPYLAAHHETHEFPDNAPGSDVVYVYPRAMTPIKVSPSSGLIVTVNAGLYMYQNEVKQFFTQTLDLTSYVPSTVGNTVRVLVYVDPVSNTLAVLTGTEVASPAIPTYPTTLANTLPLAYIQLTEAMTTITETLIADGRAFLSIGRAITGISSLYLHEEAADIAGYKQLLVTPADDPENTITAVCNSGTGEVLMEEFITYPTTGVGTTIIDGGSWHFITYAMADNATGVTDIVVHVYTRASGGAETELFNAVIASDITAVAALYEIDTVQPDFIVLATDRIVIKYYARTTSVANRTATVYYEGTARYSHFHPPAIALVGGVGGTGTPPRIAQWTAGGIIGDSTLTKTGAGVLELVAAGAYTLTVPATGTAALGSGTANRLAYWSATNVLASASFIQYDETSATPITISMSDNTKYALNMVGTFNRVLSIGGTAIANLTASAQVAASISPTIDPAGAYASLIGVQFQPGVGGSSSNNITTFQASFYRGLLSGTYSGTIDNYIALDIGIITDAGAGTPTINNAYGIRIQAQTIGGTNNYGLVVHGGLVVFNEDGLSTADFRVEGDTNANLFFVDASSDKVGFGINAPASLVHILATDALTTGVTSVLRLEHQSTGTTAGTFGLTIDIHLENSTGSVVQSAQIRSVLSTVGAGWIGDLIFYGGDSGSLREAMRMRGSGSAAQIGFYGVTPVSRPTSLTTKLTQITHTAPGTPDYAIQDLVQPAGYGFVTKDEGNTVLSVIKNLQVRVDELETKLTALGLLT